MPSKLKKCTKCSEYNLTDTCRKCKSPTESAHYKFIKIRDAPNSDNFF
jgi:rRNA maturation protein Nop10